MTTAEGDELQFGSDDIDILDSVLMRDPELRVCAWVVKRARLTGLRYPVHRPEALFSLYPDREVVLGGHRITQDAVVRSMPAEFFPVTNEEELVDRVHLALVRCWQETTRLTIVRAGAVTDLYGT